MDLKFTFGGASPDQHDHGDAPSGIPLPFAVSTAGLGSTSSVLELHATVSGDELVTEALSGDGVSYAQAAVPLADRTPSAVAAALRSGLSRAGAELDDPLRGSVTAVRLAGALAALGLDAAALLAELGCDPAAPAITEALQARTGLTVGTPILVD